MRPGRAAELRPLGRCTGLIEERISRSTIRTSEAENRAHGSTRDVECGYEANGGNRRDQHFRAGLTRITVRTPPRDGAFTDPIELRWGRCYCSISVSIAGPLNFTLRLQTAHVQAGTRNPADGPDSDCGGSLSARYLETAFEGARQPIECLCEEKRPLFSRLEGIELLG